MNWLRTQVQKWIDRKTQEIVQANEKCKHIIALSEKPGIKLGEFYQQVERYLQEQEKR